MKTLFRLLVLAAIISPVIPSGPLHAQDPERVNITGRVINALMGQPIEGVAVTFEDLRVQRVTDSAGAFTMTDIPLGPHQLTVRREGHETRSGRLTVMQAGEMTLPMEPEGGLAATDMSRVQGTVTGDEDKRVSEGATVKLLPLGQDHLTNNEGRFVFENVPPGEYQLVTEFIGYATREEDLTVPLRKILTLDLELAVEPIALDPIEVSVEAREFDLEISGFYERRDATSGLFITRERIEQRAPLFTTDLFRGLAGVKVLGGLGMGTQNAVILAGSRAMPFISTPEECHPAGWVDGQMVHQGSGPAGGGPAFLDELIRPDQIAGVEIYSSAAGVPAQYNLFSGCGVIVFWTRHGG